MRASSLWITAILGDSHLPTAANWRRDYEKLNTNAFYATFSFRLQNVGPDGKEYAHTSNRADVRAVIAALYFREWQGEGAKRVIIATDSTCVCNSVTQCTGVWEENGWQTANKEPVKNKDLREASLLGVRKNGRLGVEVVFWKIPRSLNQEADAAAKAGVLGREIHEQFMKFGGWMQGEFAMGSLAQRWVVEDQGMAVPLPHPEDWNEFRGLAPGQMGPLGAL